jgi:probable phosphoglycerate mutase
VTARILFVRHATHDLLGKILCGRMDGVGLNAHGVGQAEALGLALAAEQPTRIFTSPLLRAMQTSDAIARSCPSPIQTEPALNEIDLGEWTGASFETLSGDPDWQDWNRERGNHRPPQGESMRDVQARVSAWCRSVAAQGTNTVIAVSHSDVIKAACCAALDLSLDRYDRFDIDPCSVSELHVGSWGMKLAYLNRV